MHIKYVLLIGLATWASVVAWSVATQASGLSTFGVAFVCGAILGFLPLKEQQ